MVLNYKIFLDLLMILIQNKTEDTLIMIDEVIDIFNENRFSIRDESSVLFLISLINEIREIDLTFKDNKADILALYQKRKADPVLKTNDDLRESLETILTNEMSANTLLNSIQRIRNFILWTKCNRFVSKMYASLKESSKTENVLTQKNHLANILTTINDLKESLKIVDVNKTKFIERINFDNRKDIVDAFAKYKERKIDFCFKTGLQGLNKMYGKRNGPTLGESSVFCGLPHQYKSGMLMSFAKWAVHYNTVPKSINNKKPMILFITLENEAFENMIWWFEKLYQIISEQPPPDTMTDNEIVDFIYKYFEKNDYTFVIERYLPETFGYNDYVELIESYERAGYRIFMSIIDYLQCMNLRNDSGVNFSSTNTQNHLLIKDLFSKMCNYNKSKGISLITAHQLNREAARIVSTGVPYAVKRFNGIHLAYSADVEREPDFLAYINIEKNQKGESFLTVSRGKHRYVDDTPESDKFFAYKFDKYGIPDDVLEEKSRAVKDIYNRKKLTKEEKEEEEANAMLGVF